MKPALIATLLLGGMALAGAAAAQENTPVQRSEVAPEQRLAMDVLSRIYGDLNDLVGEEKPLEPQMLFRVMMVAKQKAAAETCDGFEMDEDRYNKVMTTALSKVAAASAAAGSQDMFLRVMMGFSTGVGAELAFAALNPEGYCAYAAELREEFKEDVDGTVLVWKDAN